ncbi:MAG: cystathionine gamma-synthase family protein [Ectothiorhodospiraceae bacterium]|nr:cystathionine gamma-synthase family protein [Ectothiorhodospiraceae bacterium]
MTDSSRRFGTRALWAADPEDQRGRDVALPIHHSVNFAYEDMDEWFDVALDQKPGYIYSRNKNPTVRPLELTMRALEGAEEAISFSTGMAAISNTLFTLLAPGDRVVAIKDTYGGTNKLFIEFLPRMKVDVALCDTLDFDTIEAEIRKGCKLLYLETPTNPTLKVVDIARLSRVAHQYGALVAVDNTFATPINQRPLELGADLVLYSATKYLNGHSDAMGGILCGPKAIVDQVYHYREINGATLHANSAYMILRGLKTLELRIQRHNENAQRVAEHLQQHDKVTSVFYPGLPDHPNHAIARAQMDGYGGMLSFSLRGGFDQVKRLLAGLRLAHKAASLGSVSTLVGPPRVTSHVELTPEERKAAGIPESLIRYSAGIENAEDLLADLDQALAGL